MYSQKCVQYCSGGFLGGDKERTFYKGIVISMIVSLKKYIPCFATSLPEASTSGHWQSRQTNRCIHDLKFTGSQIRAAVSDDHRSNVISYSVLWKKYGEY